ncbi:hypothetical protein [Paenisporosarcina sp. OV554]|uniref:hypothetical protein n=1 Tax=Paenisporosarcina sp. OV554 TaxID=2135694 RepID=UPI000D357C8C|nr:hypothetical protein [Paenisporosarcina sp. OV554]PUB02066.1 hypothetical protein C8K15_1632 [Paenisporosarcina sp. OV554]
MNKDGLYSLWVLVVFFEMYWLYSVIDRNIPATFVVTLIAVTLTLGAVGLKLFGKSDDEKK